MLSIFKKEVASYFNSLIGYLAIALFLLITGLILWVFPETSIIDAGYASLDGFFTLAPYLLIFLIPAISMRTIAGERAESTFDLLFSRPNSIKDIIIGKYLGIICIGTLAILPSIIYAVSLYFIAYPKGNIDIGATVGSYLGLLFLVCCFSAISIFCSTLTKNSIIAFLLGIFLSFIGFYGLEELSQLSAIELIETTLKHIGIQTHYESISRGVLLINDIIYFTTVSALFLLFSIGHLNKGFRARRRTFTTYAIALVLFFVLNLGVANLSTIRIDFTEDNRFTLSNKSKQLLNNLEQPIHITLFLDGKLPSGFERLKQSTIDMIRDMQAYSKGRLTMNILNPLEGNQDEQQQFTEALIDRGIYPTNLSVKTDQGFSQKLIFPSAVVSTEQQEIAINLLQQKAGITPEEVLNNSVQNLEYALLSAISQAIKKESDFIGFTEGHGEPTDLELYDAMHSLPAGNQVGRVNLDSVTYESLQQLRILFIVKPTKPFSESEKYKIDYFIRHGGSVVWAIDQIDASLEYLKENGSQPLIGRQLNIDDQLFMYGFRINYNIIADLNCSQIPLTIGNIGNQAQIELVPWYFYPILMPTSNNPILKNLDGISTQFISTVDTIESSDIKKTLLLSSSPFARTISTPSPISLQMVEETPDPRKFQSKPLPVAWLAEGNFPYIFKNRPTPTAIEKPVDLAETSKKTKMVVFGDGDWLINQINTKDQSPYPLGWDKYTEQQFANKALLHNLVDYLLNDEELILLRSREVKLRLLDKTIVSSQKLKWQIINVAAPIFLLSLLALVQQWVRRRKFGKI